MELCVSCKSCKRECPTGVDVARMKIEVLAVRAKQHGLSLRDRLVAYLPHYAPIAARMPWAFNARDAVPGAAWLTDKALGLSAERSLPRWRSDTFSDPATAPIADNSVVLWADTFNRYHERERLDAARTVLEAAGHRVHVAQPADGSTRPLCCGRTFLSAGLVDQAKSEAQRTLQALAPFLDRGIPIIGLEPSCLLTFRDEMTALGLGDAATKAASNAVLFEEFIARRHREGKLSLPLKPVAPKALLHGHCHQKAFGLMGAVEATLGLVPDLVVETIESSCCGMAGAFGYQSETIGISKAMAELSLLPAVRAAAPGTLIVADGTSCRHQIADATTAKPLHVAEVLAMSLSIRHPGEGRDPRRAAFWLALDAGLHRHDELNQ